MRLAGYILSALCYVLPKLWATDAQKFLYIYLKGEQIFWELENKLMYLEKI